MDATTAGCYLGSASALIVVSGFIFCGGRFGGEHLAVMGSAFLTSFNIVPPFYLGYFIFNDTLRKTLSAGLIGYEKYIVFAAVCSLAITLITLASVFHTAWKKPALAVG